MRRTINVTEKRTFRHHSLIEVFKRIDSYPEFARMGRRAKEQDTPVPQNSRERREVSVTCVDESDLTFCTTYRQNGKENSGWRRVSTECSSVSSQRRSLRQTNNRPDNDNEDGKLVKIDEEALPEEFTVKHSRPLDLLGENDGLVPAGFQTPRKRKSMVLKAQESASKYLSPLRGENTATPNKSTRRKDCNGQNNTPNRRVSFNGEIGATPSKGNNTPTKGLLKRRESVSTTPKARMSLMQDDACSSPGKYGSAIDKTPRLLRSRTIALVQKHLAELESDDGDFSSDEEDAFKPCDESSESSSDISSDEDTVTLKRKRKEQTFKDDINSEAYFRTQSSKQITSNNTLSRLRNPRLEKDNLLKLLEDVDSSHQKPISLLSKSYRSVAKQMLFSLWEGYSILLYGVGSKRHLLQSLHREELQNCDVLVVNGFFPDVTIKQVLEEILTGILEVKEVPSNTLECVDLIESIQSRKHADPVYLMINNLDGSAFRNDRAQAILSHLAQLPKIHLIASIDHINAPLLWDQAKLRRFNFVWWDATTFVAYNAETSYESSLLIHDSGVTLASLHSVFKSLIANAKKVYLIIAKNQLDNAKDKNFSGISFQELYWKCRASFLASSDKVLRAQLTEFLDHELLKTRRGVDGVETLMIPIKSNVLSEFVEIQEKEAV